MTTTTFKHHKYSLTVYLILAMGITWLGWIPGLVIGTQQGYLMPNFSTYVELFEIGFVNSQHIWLGIAFQFAVYGPLIGGLIATWMDGGKEGLADLWKRMIKWNVGWRWYVSTFAITFLLTGIPVSIFALTGNFVSSTVSLSFVLLIFIAQLFTSGLGEEPGWRGFLLPRLRARFEGEKHIWMLGLIWAIWHYPLTIYYSLPAYQGVPIPQMAIMILLALAGQTMTLIGITFIYVWLYNRTQSIFLLMVFHALSNLLSYWLVTFLADPQAVGLLPALMPWVFVIFFQKRLGKENFPGTPQA